MKFRIFQMQSTHVVFVEWEIEKDSDWVITYYGPNNRSHLRKFLFSQGMFVHACLIRRIGHRCFCDRCIIGWLPACSPCILPPKKINAPHRFPIGSYWIELDTNCAAIPFTESWFRFFWLFSGAKISKGLSLVFSSVNPEVCIYRAVKRSDEVVPQRAFSRNVRLLFCLSTL